MAEQEKEHFKLSELKSKRTNLFTESDFLAVPPIFETLVFWKAAILKENKSSNPALLRRISFLGIFFVAKDTL